jgi:hypothetical protein
MAKDDIYQVTTTFVITLGDADVEYHAGEIVDGDDPAYKRVPEHFGPVEFKHRKAEKPKTEKAEKAEAPKVEQATAAPGEQRGKAITTASFKGRQ